MASTNQELPGGVVIERLPLERIDEVEPLWSALREHHGSVAPHLGPTRSRAESWKRRRNQYVNWLGDPDAFALVARRDGGAPLAYALVAVRGEMATWDVGLRSAVLETLAVLPSERGEGIGSTLIARVRAELRDLGITNLGLDVIATNASAIRLYEREGFQAVTVAMWSTVEP